MCAQPKAGLNTQPFNIINGSQLFNTVELTVHTSCYWVLDLLCDKNIRDSYTSAKSSTFWNPRFYNILKHDWEKIKWWTLYQIFMMPYEKLHHWSFKKYFCLFQNRQMKHAIGTNAKAVFWYILVFCMSGNLFSHSLLSGDLVSVGFQH